MSSVVLARWDRDMVAMNEAIRLMLGNKLAEAEQLLDAASKEVEARDIDFSAGDHDMRGAFAFVLALFQLLHGLATLENNQLETALERVWRADELLQTDGDWPGRTVLRGLCLVVAGLVQVMQGSFARGICQILRSWLFLRTLEKECLNYQGHERSCVRSTALLGLGVFNLLSSLLPERNMKAAQWATGFTGGRDTALEQLRLCWEEGGVQAPFAGIVVVGVAVDVSGFLGEFSGVLRPRLAYARQILDVAAECYPGAFFFQGLGTAYLAVSHDLPGALLKLDRLCTDVAGVPAFKLMVCVRSAQFSACALDWTRAARHFVDACEVHRAVGRRALCPTFSFMAYVCHLAGGEEEAAGACLDTCLSYAVQRKKWNALDADALQCATIEHVRRKSGDCGLSPRDAAAFRPLLFLLRRVAVLYRGGGFMSPEEHGHFMSLLREETLACGSDVDNRVLCLSVQAEAMRQSEDWEEVLRIAEEGLALEAQVSSSGRRTGALLFLCLNKAFAHLGKGDLIATKTALSDLRSMKDDARLFRKQVSFRTTHLERVVGMEWEDAYTELSVPARAMSRLVVTLPEEVAVGWDWVLSEHTINFTAVFRDVDGNASTLSAVAEHPAGDACTGRFDVLGPGMLELMFDNSHSLLRSKTVQYRVEPKGLALSQDP